MDREQSSTSVQGKVCSLLSPIKASASEEPEDSNQNTALNTEIGAALCCATQSLCSTSVKSENTSSSTSPDSADVGGISTEETIPTSNQMGKPAVSEQEFRSKTVYVWDLDETLIIFQTLSTSKFAEAYNGSKDAKYGVKLGRKWETLILKVCDEFCFYEQVEDYNEPNIAALSQYDDGANLANYDFNADGIGPPFTDSERRKLAYRHRWIKDVYSQGLENLLKDDTLEEWKDLYEATDQYTNGWLSAGYNLLEECSKSRGSAVREAEPNGCLAAMANLDDMHAKGTERCTINTVVTSGTLIPSLVKLLLFRLNTFIDSINVYSSREVGKLQCFKWIKERFEAPNVKFCAVGDGLDECDAAEALCWPFLKVDLRPESPHSWFKITHAVLKQYIAVVYGGEEEN